MHSWPPFWLHHIFPVEARDVVHIKLDVFRIMVTVYVVHQETRPVIPLPNQVTQLHFHFSRLGCRTFRIFPF
jgi:hypothetical protein